MNLQTDWQEEAKKLTEGMQPTNPDVAYIQGAQSYANAVEALLKDKINQAKTEQSYGELFVLELLLEELTTLTPTSNE